MTPSLPLAPDGSSPRPPPLPFFLLAFSLPLVESLEAKLPISPSCSSCAVRMSSGVGGGLSRQRNVCGWRERERERLLMI